jgi:hypothetical protein
MTNPGLLAGIYVRLRVKWLRRGLLACPPQWVARACSTGGDVFPRWGWDDFPPRLDLHGSGCHQRGQKLHRLLQPERRPDCQELGSELGDFDEISNPIGERLRSIFAVSSFRNMAHAKTADEDFQPGKTMFHSQNGAVGCRHRPSQISSSRIHGLSNGYVKS